MESNVVFEDLYELGQDYPHIYGTLNINEIQGVHEFKSDENGEYTTPIFIIKNM